MPDRPDGGRGGESLNELQLRYLLACGAQLVDVRTPGDFRRGTLPGARNLPLMALGHDHGQLDRRAAVILCGGGPVLCRRAAWLLAGRGFRRIYHYG